MALPHSSGQHLCCRPALPSLIKWLPDVTQSMGDWPYWASCVLHDHQKPCIISPGWLHPLFPLPSDYAARTIIKTMSRAPFLLNGFSLSALFPLPSDALYILFYRYPIIQLRKKLSGQCFKLSIVSKDTILSLHKWNYNVLEKDHWDWDLESKDHLHVHQVTLLDIVVVSAEHCSWWNSVFRLYIQW